MSIADDIRSLGELGPDFDDIVDKVKQFNLALQSGDKVTKAQLSTIRSTGKEYVNLSQALEKVIEGTIKTNTLQNKAAELTGKAANLQAKQDDLIKKANAARNAGNTAYAKDLIEQAKLVRLTKDELSKMAIKYAELVQRNEELNKKGAFFKNLGKLTGLIPGLEKLSGNFKEVGNAVREAYIKTGDFTKAAEKGFLVLSDILIKAFIAQIFVVNKELAKIQRNLNLSAGEAILAKGEFMAIETTTNDIAVNSVRIAKANQILNDQLGTATIFSGELLTTTSKLVEVVGLSAESAGSLAQQALISGQELREVEENALAGSYALQRSTGIALKNKDILEATGKVTGQVRINLGANPTLIAEAVTKAKLLGMELDTINNASKQLLSFESSISNELEAELLTGKQLNLERARALALQGDLAGVADEIAAQNINFSEFQGMNVLQQEALAKAVGMTADGLSDALITQEAQGRTATELRAIGKGELADRLEVLDAQEKIALATEKFTVFLGNVATVLSPIADIVGFIAQVFSTLPGKLAIVIAILGRAIPLMKAFSLNAMRGAISAMFAAPPPLGLITGALGTAALIAAIAQTTGIFKADDMMYGNNTLITKNKGAIALNNNDTIVAGTNLFGGNDRGGEDREPRWLGKLIGGINNKKVKFDTYDSAGPQAMVDSFSKNENNLFI